MGTYSLRTLLATVLLSSIAFFTLVNPNFAFAVTLLVLMLVSLLWLATFGVIQRRPLPVVSVALCCGYLVVADGGLIPELERRLPSEWMLNKISTPQSNIENGLKRSRSLSTWAWNVLTVKDHKDEDRLYPVQSRPSKRDGRRDEADLALSDLTVALPSFTLTTVSTIRTIARRDSPENRLTFIIGHCWFVIAVIAITFLMLAQDQIRKTNHCPATADAFP